MDVQNRPKEKGYEQRLRELLQLVPLVLVRSQSIADRLQQLGCNPNKIRMNRTGIPLSGFPFVERSFPADGRWSLLPRRVYSPLWRPFRSFDEYILPRI
jgi:hypothetical protein